MKLFFCHYDPLMGEPFWQNNSLVSHILFELQPLIIFSPVANFGNQSLIRTFSWKNMGMFTLCFECVGIQNFLKLCPHPNSQEDHSGYFVRFCSKKYEVFLYCRIRIGLKNIKLFKVCLISVISNLKI